MQSEEFKYPLYVECQGTPMGIALTYRGLMQIINDNMGEDLFDIQDHHWFNSQGAGEVYVINFNQGVDVIFNLIQVSIYE